MAFLPGGQMQGEGLASQADGPGEDRSRRDLGIAAMGANE
jgi:hypothetical protein